MAPRFREIVSALVDGSFGPRTSLRGVAAISTEKARHIYAYIADYGETLTQLSEDTWESSVALWMGTHWDVFIDLWTVESGSSDLVLAARVHEGRDGFLIDIQLVYVP